MGRGGSLGHETSKVSVEDSNILERCYESDVSIWSDDDNRACIAVNSVGRISLSAGPGRDGDVVDENPEALPRCQS